MKPATYIQTVSLILAMIAADGWHIAGAMFWTGIFFGGFYLERQHEADEARKDDGNQ